MTGNGIVVRGTNDVVVVVVVTGRGTGLLRHDNGIEGNLQDHHKGDGMTTMENEGEEEDSMTGMATGDRPTEGTRRTLGIKSSIGEKILTGCLKAEKKHNLFTSQL